MTSISKVWGGKFADYLLGISLVSWAVVGLVDEWGDFKSIFPVRLGLSLLQFSIGLLFFFRPMALEQGSLRAFLLSVPSFLLSGLLYRLSLPLEDWPMGARILFGVALIWVGVSFWSLRGSFAIFPARRAVVRGGLYAFVRHPAYLGELALASACGWAACSWWALACWLALVPMVGLRIMQEEELMRQDVLYLFYAEKHKWRLLPWIW